MRYQYKISNNAVVFSKWTRKSYAIFASLNRVINIARLSIDICVASFGKIQAMLRLLNQGIGIDANESDSPEREEELSEWIMRLLLKSGITEINESYSFKKLNKVLVKVHIPHNAEYGLFY